MEKRLKELRLTLKLQQGDFAKELDIVQQQLSKYERGENKPSADILIKLAQKFKLNLNWLLTGCGTMFLDEFVSGAEIIRVKAPKGAKVLIEYEQ